MPNSQVEVVDVTALYWQNAGPTLDVEPTDSSGDLTLTRAAAKMAISAFHRKSAARIFRLSWRGSKTPRGAVVANETIMTTQNGVVHNTDRTRIGTYERLVEFGGPSENEQEMLVYLGI